MSLTNITDMQHRPTWQTGMVNRKAPLEAHSVHPTYPHIRTELSRGEDPQGLMMAIWLVDERCLP
ncbi:hypothetical protein N7513_005826 [Penicillium frequentans]|nr:hypothetical protein N7513_005826 [Penicillium glabrum]